MSIITDIDIKPIYNKDNGTYGLPFCRQFVKNKLSLETIVNYTIIQNYLDHKGIRGVKNWPFACSGFTDFLGFILIGKNYIIDCVSMYEPNHRHRKDKEFIFKTGYETPETTNLISHYSFGKTNRKAVRKSNTKSVRKSNTKSVRKSVRKSNTKSVRKSNTKSVRKSARKSSRKTRRKL